MIAPWDDSNEPFAVWPEDNPRDARRECLQHLADQPWRLSARGVEQRFTEWTLGLSKTDDFVAAVATRRLGPCWYVTYSSPREGYAQYNVGHRWEGDDLVAVVDWRGHGSADVQMGFGGETQTARPTDVSPAEFRFEDVGEPGHLILRYVLGSHTELYAEPLPIPPPAAEVAVVRVPKSEVAAVRRTGLRSCRRQYSLGFAWTSSPRGSLHGLKRELQAGRGSLSDARFIRHGKDWIFEVDDARLLVDMDRVGNCYRVVAVDPIGQDLGLQVLKGPRRVTLSFDWLEADTADVQAVDGTYYLRKTELPLTFHARSEHLANLPDFVFLTLYKGERLYSAIAYEVAQ